MYDQDEAPTFRRGLWVILWFVVIIAVLWTLIWLIFFRHSSPKTPTLQGSNTNQNQSSDNKSNSNSGSSKSSDKNGANNGGGGGNTAPSAPSNTSGSSANQLANTGAGDVVVPFVVASVAGTAIYYVRLRRKALSN